MITKNQLDVLVTSKFDLLKSKDIFKNNLEELKKTIEADLTDLASLALPETCNGRFDFFKLEGTIAADFRERIIEIEKDKIIMAGIRFRGLNINRPFVSINPGFRITESNLSLIAAFVKEEFKIFNPQSIQFPMIPEARMDNIDLQIDRYTIVGNCHELLKISIPEFRVKTELIEIKNESFYEKYLEEYKTFHQKNPNLLDEVKPESLEDLLDSMKNKLLFEICIDNKMAGIISGTPYEYYGQKGVYIIEEILYDSFKGYGYGVLVQRKFIELVADRYQVLWGTISDLNPSSLKTALRNGRKIEEIEYLYKL